MLFIRLRLLWKGSYQKLNPFKRFQDIVIWQVRKCDGIPGRHEYREHVDEHQVELAQRLLGNELTKDEHDYCSTKMSREDSKP